MPATVDASFFLPIKIIAIIGAKDKPGSAVNRVGRYLIDAGFTVIPVHPKRTGVWGLTTYTSITEIPHRVDMINVFRSPEQCLLHAQEACAMNPHPRSFWMQQGISNKEAKVLLEQNSIDVQEDLCLMIEHSRVFHRPLAPHGSRTLPPMPTGKGNVE